MSRTSPRRRPRVRAADDDSEALIQHGENLAHLTEAIIATGSVVFGELLGEPSAELRARFADDGPVQLFTPWATM